MLYLKPLQKLVKRTVRMPLASLNYHLGSYKKDAIWLVGDGRSGTTWLSDLINWDGRYREIFEPFHPIIVKQAQNYELFQYVRPTDTGASIQKFLESVFDGSFKHTRADVSRLRLIYQGLLVKDIFANLLIPWVDVNLPHVKKVLIIRNPFAVALSKQKRKNWFWMIDPNKFLEQKELYDDYLAPFEDIIATPNNDFIINQILIWAVVHYVPLKYLQKNDTHILFYEHLVKNPEYELSTLFNFLYGEYNSPDTNKFLTKVRKPARTAGKQHGILSSKKDATSSWLDEITPKQIDSGMQILERFGLDKLYGEGTMPAKL